MEDQEQLEKEGEVSKALAKKKKGTRNADEIKTRSVP
jgi:hypothetical protein